jgi:hypothetical protein
MTNYVAIRLKKRNGIQVLIKHAVQFFINTIKYNQRLILKFCLVGGFVLVVSVGMIIELITGKQVLK